MARRSARLVVRVVLVPAGPGAADARRRVAEVLLRAASTLRESPCATLAANEAPAPPGEKAA